MTQNAINSCLNSGDGFNIYVIETCIKHKYEYATTIYNIKPDFNYNECLNIGTRHSKGRYIAYCNNDLIFYDKWAENILHVFEAHKYLSLCPNFPRSNFADDDYIIEGYLIGQHIPGWCICVDRDIWKTLGAFSERIEFWYSDDVYKAQLLKYGIKHGLVCNSVVEHIEGGSMTLKYEKRKIQNKLTNSQDGKFRNALKNL